MSLMLQYQQLGLYTQNSSAEAYTLLKEKDRYTQISAKSQPADKFTFHAEKDKNNHCI